MMKSMENGPDIQSGMQISPSEASGPKYPYGLQINLDRDSLQKAGLTAESMSVGGEYELRARCVVTSVSKQPGSALQSTMSEGAALQITDMEIKDMDNYDSAFAEASA